MKILTFLFWLIACVLVYGFLGPWLISMKNTPAAAIGAVGVAAFTIFLLTRILRRFNYDKALKDLANAVTYHSSDSSGMCSDSTGISRSESKQIRERERSGD